MPMPMMDMPLFITPMMKAPMTAPMTLPTPPEADAPPMKQAAITSSSKPRPALGVGKVMGAVIGAFVMGVMNNGMSILGIGIDYQQVIKGVVLLAAVLVDVYNKNKA